MNDALQRLKDTEKEILDQVVDICGRLYNIPNNFEKILAGLYGDDYMQLPPEDERTTHNPVMIDFGDKN